MSSFGGGHVAELAHKKNCRAADNPLNDGEQGLDGVGGKDRPLVGQPLLDVGHEVVVRGDPFGNLKAPRATQGWMCVGEEDRKVIREPFAAGQVRVRWQRDARCHEAVQHSGIEAVEPGGTGPGTRLSDVRMNGLEDFRNTKVGEGAGEAGALQFGGREVVGGAAGIARMFGEVRITSNDEVSWTDGERRRELGKGLSAFRGGTAREIHVDQSDAGEEG